MTDPIERHLDDFDIGCRVARGRFEAALTDAVEAVSGIKSQRDYMETQRDGHRRALNQIADMLRVVHEDPKIVQAVHDMAAAAAPGPMGPGGGAAIHRAAMLWPRTKAEADALVFAFKFFAEELRNDDEYRERLGAIEAMLARAGIKI